MVCCLNIHVYRKMIFYYKKNLRYHTKYRPASFKQKNRTGWLYNYIDLSVSYCLIAYNVLMVQINTSIYLCYPSLLWVCPQIPWWGRGSPDSPSVPTCSPRDRNPEKGIDIKAFLKPYKYKVDVDTLRTFM